MEIFRFTPAERICSQFYSQLLWLFFQNGSKCWKKYTAVLWGCLYLSQHQENCCITTQYAGGIIKGVGEKVSLCTLLILTVTLKSGCVAEYHTLSMVHRLNSIWPMHLPEQGVWHAFKWDPLWTVGELKAGKINPAESAGRKGVWSSETSPEAEAKTLSTNGAFWASEAVGGRGRDLGGTCRDEEIVIRKEEWRGGLWWHLWCHSKTGWARRELAGKGDKLWESGKRTCIREAILEVRWLWAMSEQ